jgi:hypothetical protein
LEVVKKVTDQPSPVVEIKYGVGLLGRKGIVVEYAAGGINDTGKEKVCTTRDSSKAHKFSLQTAHAVAKKVGSWGSCPVIVDMDSNTIVESIKPTPRPAPKPKPTIGQLALDVVKTVEALNGKPDQELRDIIKPLLSFWVGR